MCDVDRITEAIAAELDEHGYEDDDEKRWQVAKHFVRVAVDALQLTPEVLRPDGVTWTKAAMTRLVSPWVVAKGRDDDSVSQSHDRRPAHRQADAAPGMGGHHK